MASLSRLGHVCVPVRLPASHTLLCYWCSNNAGLLPLTLYAYESEQIISDRKQNKGYFHFYFEYEYRKNRITKGDTNWQA